MKEIIFELKSVCYSYLGNYPALAGIDMTIRSGEKIAVIGANGTGKSTLLHLLDGLIFPTHGTIIAFSQALEEKSFRDEEFARRFRSKIGMVFQNTEIQLFCASVREDIAFGPLQLGIHAEEVKRRLAEVAQIMGIQPLLERVPHQLSIGEKRKAAIATVLAIDPEVLLLDEPTAGLDPTTVRHIVDLLLAANQCGKTILIATHDLHLVEEMSDAVYVLGGNRKIIRYGSPAEILTDQALLASNNLIHAHGHKHNTIRHAHWHCHTGF